MRREGKETGNSMVEVFCQLPLLSNNKFVTALVPTAGLSELANEHPPLLVTTPAAPHTP